MTKPNASPNSTKACRPNPLGSIPSRIPVTRLVWPRIEFGGEAIVRHIIWIVITLAAAGAWAATSPRATASGEHWFVISYMDGAVGYDAESIDLYGRDGIKVTVGGYSPEPIETQGGIPAHYFVEAAEFDCKGNVNIRSSSLFDASRRRVEEERDMPVRWRSTRPSSIYLAINAAVCESYALRNAREAFSLYDALGLMKAVAQ